MKRRTPKAGFTLVELLIATTVTTLVLASLCGVYFSTAREWERQQGEADALLATSQTCTRLSDYVSQAVGAVIATRFRANDTIGLNMPADRAYGVYAPIWTGGHVQYRSGSWIVFYLSDSTGSYLCDGDILWAGTAVGGVISAATVTPDRSWSMYYNSQLGRTSSVSSLSSVLDNTGERPAVTITVTSRYDMGTTSKTISQSRTVYLRNAN